MVGPVLLSAQDCHAEYQPVVDLGTFAVVGEEALLRARVGSTALSPAELFAVTDPDVLASRNRLAIEVALRQRPTLAAGVWLMLKVDASVGRRVVTGLSELVGQAGLSPDQAVVEVPFAPGGTDAAAALGTLAAARAQGLRTAVSSVGGVRRLAPFLVSVDVVKFSARLLEGHDHELAQVLRASDDHGVRTLAFGVETAAAASYVRDAGVTWGQGWHLARPRRPLGSGPVPAASTS